MARIGPGDTLVVVRIDRLARSLALVRAMGRLAAEGLAADPALLAPCAAPAPSRSAGWIVAGIARAAPNLTLRAIAAELERLREKTPRGGTHWSPSSVAHILDR